MKTHPDSRKKEGRIRIDGAIINMPEDLRSQLSSIQTDLRYGSMRDALWAATHYGCIVLRKLADTSHTIANNSAQEVAGGESL